MSIIIVLAGLGVLMRKYLLIFLCFLCVSGYTAVMEPYEILPAFPGEERDQNNVSKFLFTFKGAIEFVSYSSSGSVNPSYSCDGCFNAGGYKLISFPFVRTSSVETTIDGSITAWGPLGTSVSVTYNLCPDTSKCNKQTCNTCGEWYCSVHETHTGCSADDHADGDHPYNRCPKGCSVCMTCHPEHVGTCECGQQVYGCEQHECPLDCGHDNLCPKCGKVCMTCNPSHVGPCEDCQQPVYGCETNHKCHEGEFGHPLQKCPNCDVCLTCDPSHGSTCEHCDQYFYACENHNPVQEECSVCHAVYWSCVGHDVANLCPTCHGSNFCGVNGCKVCMDCRPDHLHEEPNVCPVCKGSNFCPYCKKCLDCNQHMAVCDTCKKAYFACRDHDCEGGTDGVCPVCLKKNFCSKCDLCINCNPNHCGTTGNTCNHNNLCKKCGKVCMTCNPSHTCGGGGGDCGHNNPCGVNGCTVCKTCKPDHVHVNKPPVGCGHNNLCPKCGKVCMTCNPQHNCGGSGGGTGDDPEEEKEYPDLEIPESPEFVLPTSEALTLLLEKLSPPSFTRGGSGSSGSDVTVIGGINYPKFTIPLDLSGAPFHCGDYSFEVDCVKFSESPLSLLPRITKAASVVLFAYIFIMAVIRSLRQW